MLKKFLLSSTAASLALGASLASAGTMGVACPPYEYLAGPYIGGSIGSQINTISTPSAYRGIAGTLSGGWGMRWGSRFYLAGEVFGGSNIQTWNRPLPGAEATGSVKSSYFYGVDAIPGFLINERVLAYVRAGGIWTRFNQVNQTKGGWNVGVGGQTNIVANIDVRAEYVFSEFNKLASGDRPLQDLFNVGLVYKFV